MVSATSFLGQAVAGLLLLTSAVQAAEPWPRNARMPGHIIGGKDGSDFNLLCNAGTTVALLRVYRTQSGRKHLRGIYFECTDGKSMQAGVMEDEYREIRFKDGETINAMTLWGDGIGTRTGRIVFDTSSGQKFEYGKDDVSKQDAFAMKVGSGHLLGFFGRSGADINAMSPAFLKPVKSLVVTDVKYPKLDASKGLELKTLRQSEAVWSGSPYDMDFSGWEDTAETTTWNFDFTTSLTAGVEFEAGLPLIAKSKVKFEWTVGITSSHGGSKTSSNRLAWGLKVPIKSANDSVRCTAEYWAGDAQIDWTGKMHIELRDEGTKMTYPTGGSLKRVSSSKVLASCQPLTKDSKRAAIPPTKLPVHFTA